MGGEKYFDIKRDIAICDAGGFWCNACLVGKSASEQSLDPRYCKGCYEVLSKEAEMLPFKSRRPEWIPQAQKASEKIADIPQHTPQIMSPIKGGKTEVDIIQPSVAKVTRGKRGPKQKPLPQELIEQWAGKGMGSKAIALKLKTEHGIDVSYKTIQRVLSGKRKG